jgi:succinate dehydrogenase (ubiquinone) membrane anchor subunit
MFERAISVALLPISAAAVAKHGASGLVDASLALTLVVHSHIGE